MGLIVLDARPKVDELGQAAVGQDVYGRGSKRAGHGACGKGWGGVKKCVEVG